MRKTASPAADPMPRYAKLTAPRLAGLLPRARLYALLDTMRSAHPVLWVTGPPGAGKTTLASAYLQRQAAGLGFWYQVDAGDGEAASLFFFLGEMVRDSAAALPTLLAERADAPGRMQRLFLRDFYARLPAGAVLVFDNVHELDWERDGALMQAVFEEAPQGVTVLALSRHAPPPALARMQLGGRLATIGWDALRMDAQEAAALAAFEGGAAEQNQAWLDLVDGWIAGLVMLANLQPQAASGAVPLLQGREAVFHYFAGEIFERLPADDQLLLAQLSFLPTIAADDARALTGAADAVALLERLHRDRLFTERRGDADVSYRFHALFREFLQQAARRRMTPAARTALAAQAAAILDARGAIEDAAQLYLDAGAWAELAGFMLRHAQHMMDAERGQRWREWMSSLPAELTDKDARFWYWHGVSLRSLTPQRARALLERAEAAFGAAGDEPARLACLAAIVETFDGEWRGFEALAALAARIAVALEVHAPGQLDADLELLLCARLVQALQAADADSPLLAPAAERALQCLPRAQRSAVQLDAGAILLHYFAWCERADAANWLVKELSELADDAGISPLQRVRWYAQVARWHNRDGNFEDALQSTGSARRIVAHFGLDPLLFQFLELHHLLGTGELAEARRLLDEMRTRIAPHDKRGLIELAAMEAHWRALAEDVDGAIAAMDEAVAISESEGLPGAERSRHEAFLAACHALKGDAAASALWYEHAASHAYGFDAERVQEARVLAGAYFAALQGRGGLALDGLRAALAAHRQRQGASLFPLLPQLASLVAGVALRHDIEAAHVREIIARQRLRPPPRFAQNWPWAIRVLTFGRFEVQLDGRPLVAQGKTQHRPLMLLKALAAAGRTGRAQTALLDQLWPSASDAKSALNVTVFRLRKLLGADDILVVNSGKIQLVDGALWTDVGAFQDVCEQIERLPAGASNAEVQRLAGDLLGLYGGPFCAEDDEGWVLPARERFAARFLSAAAALGARLEAFADWRAAAVLYERALAAEPLAEVSYRGLIRCLRAQNDPGAALATYRRCVEVLQREANRAPSDETRRLAQMLEAMGS